MKKIALLMVCMMAATAVFAQNGVNKSSSKPANWQVSAGAGAQYFWNGTRTAGETKDHVTPQIEVAVGKWFSPVLGVRAGVNGFNLKGYSNNDASPFAKAGQKFDFNYLNAHVDVMFDLFNAVCPCEYRLYSMIPYVGAGAAFAGFSDNTSLSFNAGLINRFNVSAHWDLDLNLNGMLVDKKWDGNVGNNWRQATVGATVGVTYKF